jgi:hypothetical protein
MMNRKISPAKLPSPVLSGLVLALAVFLPPAVHAAAPSVTSVHGGNVTYDGVQGRVTQIGNGNVADGSSDAVNGHQL